MRDMNTVEVATVSGGERDLASAMGAWLGWSAGYGLWAYDLGGFNVGGVLTGLGSAMGGAVVARFADGLLDKHINPVVDSVVG